MDKEQFTKEILAAEAGMYRIARSILRTEEDCADAMQSAILAAYSGLGGLKKESFFRTWLTRILINECYQILRKRRKQVSYEEYMANAGNAKEGAVGQEGMAGLKMREESEVFVEIMAMEEKYRIPFVLHYVEGYSVKEIAGILHCTEGSIKTRLYRSRKQLRDRLKGVMRDA